MKLVDDWRNILRRAWSVRLWALAAVFEAAGMVLPLFSDTLPRVTFSALALITAAGGIWARLIDQKGIK